MKDIYKYIFGGMLNKLDYRDYCRSRFQCSPFSLMMNWTKEGILPHLFEISNLGTFWLLIADCRNFELPPNRSEVRRDGVAKQTVEVISMQD